MKTIIFTITALLLLGFHAFGQETTLVHPNGRIVILRADKTWDYAPEEESKSYNNLPVNFTGDNVDKVKESTRAVAKKVVKDEFETQTQFNDRLKESIKQTKFQNKSLSNIVLTGTPDISYNAETQAYSTMISALEISGNRIILTDEEKMFETAPGFSDRLSFKMAPEKARTIKPDLRVAAFGYPIGMDKYRTKDMRFLVNKLSVYNVKTGEVYYEKSFEKPSQNPPKENAETFDEITAQKGDTVQALAARHNYDPAKVAGFNGFMLTTVLAEGSKLRVNADMKAQTTPPVAATSAPPPTPAKPPVTAPVPAADPKTRGTKPRPTRPPVRRPRKN